VRERREPLPTRVDLLPELPPDYDRVLREGLRSLGIALERGQRQAVDDHVRLLLAWTEAINLTGIRDPADVAREHVLDSLAALPLLQRGRFGRLLDLGSGGGFPGLPLAVALPGSRALLVESIGKKARFLETAVAAIGLSDRVRIAAARAESLAASAQHRAHWPLVVARAIAPLRELAELALPLLSPGGALIAWKRFPVDSEIDRAKEAIRMLGGGAVRTNGVPVAGLEDHVLLTIEKVGPTSREFPRDPAERRHHPL